MVLIHKPISWIGKSYKIDRRSKETNYAGYNNLELKLTVNVDDYVLVRNDDSGQPESVDFCYIARVKKLFERDGDFKDSDEAECFAEVQWYSRLTDICESHQKLVIDADYEQELLQDHRNHDNVIDVETIFAKCSVILIDHHLNGSMFLDTRDADGNPVFFCRWIYNGTANIKPVKGYQSPNMGKITKKVNGASQVKEKLNNVKKSLRSTSKNSKFLDEENDFSSDDDFTLKRKGKSVQKPNAKNIKVSKPSKTRKTRKTPVKSLKYDSESSSSDKEFLESLDKPKRRNTRLTNLTQKPDEISHLLFDEDSSDDDHHSEKSVSSSGTVKLISLNPSRNLRTPVKATPSKKVAQTPVKATPSKKAAQTPVKQISPPKKTPVVTPLKILKDKEKSSFILTKKKGRVVIDSETSEDEIKQPNNSKASRTKRLAAAASPVKKTATKTPKKKLNITPNYLPCRETEFDDIYSFIEGKLVEETGGCMYISGVPGTGKTASIRRVLNYLREKVDSKLIPEFKLVEVNAMNLTAPHQCYVQILKQLTGKKASPDQALQIIQKTFANSGEAIVMVIDELDLLWTKRQDVMYSLFDWPNMINSKLIVLAIANTMDLPERLMMNRVSSRLGLTRKTFHPYNHQQLQEIVKSTMEKEKVKYNPDAIQLVSRKVAAVSGDARRALEIWKRAKELASSDNKMLELSHVDKAFQEMFCAPKILAIRSASSCEKTLLQAIVAEFLRTGLEESTFGPVYNQFVDFCRVNEVKTLNHSQVSELLARLHSLSILLIEHGKGDILQRIRLNVSVDDVNYALRRN